MAIELVIYGARQFGIKEYPSRAYGDLCYRRSRRRVEDNLGIYGSSGISYGGLSRGGCEAYLLVSHFDRQKMLFPLFFWSTRDHSSLFKSMYEEHLCRSPDK